jgi:hypothetical protein
MVRHERKTKMAKHSTSGIGPWYRPPFGRRVMGPGPFFVISDHSDPEGRDARRRRALADLAGL